MCNTSHYAKEAKATMMGSKQGCNSSLSLLELAANNDLKGFKHAVEEEGAKVDESESWYCHLHGSNRMAVVERTPIMIAALYGSIDVLEFILKHFATHGGNVNEACGIDRNSALHSAVASGASNTDDVVKLLLNNGADPTLVDVHGLQPFDFKRIVLSPSSCQKKVLLDKSMSNELPADMDLHDWNDILPDSVSDTSFGDLDDMWAGAADVGMTSTSPVSSSPASSPKSADTSSGKASKYDNPKGFPCDVLCSDIKNSIYATDEFRMYSFKVRPCSRAYSHDWTECPFVHPGENARRRDPRRFHYSCVPCPDFRKGACRHGDGCEYAHGVFESWLHPAQYRTRLCKDGTSCTRKVCFFAHTKEEVRPLYLSSECGGTSPWPMASTDAGAMSSPRGPASPSATTFRPPSFSPVATASGLSSSPLSPLSDKQLGSAWSHGGLPSLHLPEGLQAGSRLRASLSARDIYMEDVNQLSDMDGQIMREINRLSTQARLNAVAAASSPSKHPNFGSLNLISSSLDDLSLSNVAVSPRSPLQMCLQSSPRVTGKLQNAAYGNVTTSALEEFMVSSLAPSLRPQSNRSLQSQYESLLQPHRMSQCQSQVQSDVASQLQDLTMPQSQASAFGLSSPSHVSRQELDFVCQHGMGSPLGRAHAIMPPQKDNGSPIAKNSERGVPWMDWGSPTGKPEWGVSGDDLTKFRKSTSLKVTSERLDAKWMQDIGKNVSAGCAVKLACKG